MREIYEKYYTVRLYSCPDLHFAPTIIDIPGEYDTEEEARVAAEPEYRKTCSYNEVTGQSYSWFEVQVLEHYKKLLKNTCEKEERKIGKWIVEKDSEGKTRTLICPFCKWKSGKYAWENYNFCPNCGVKMEVDDEE